MSSDDAPTSFRRLFIDHGGALCCEVRSGECWYLPQAGEGYKHYDPSKVFTAVKAAQVVNLSRWRRLTEGDET